MFDWFKRLFSGFVTKDNAVMVKIEDSAKMADQVGYELKNDLIKVLQVLAEVKAIALFTKRAHVANLERAAQYEQQAMILRQGGQKEDINSSDVDRLVDEALEQKEQIMVQVLTDAQNIAQYEDLLKKMEADIQKLKQQIREWEYAYFEKKNGK